MLKMNYFADLSTNRTIAPIRMKLRDVRQVDQYGLTEEEVPVKYWDKKSEWLGNDSGFSRRRALISNLRELKDFVEDDYLSAKKEGGISKGWLRNSIHSPSAVYLDQIMIITHD